MDMEALISVIIPAYNAAPYLKNCLDSVLSQTYRRLEIVLVDDGSTDETLEIADSYQDRFPDRIKVIHTENRGVTSARFTGVRAASGEWIGFVDADDEIEPDMYERLLSNALKYNADISHCGHQTIVNNGARVHYFYNTGRFAVQDRKTGMKDLLEGVFEPSLWNKLMKRELLLEIIAESAIDLSIKFNEDYLMNYYLFSRAKSTVYEDFCGYHYLARSDSATRKSFQVEKSLDPVRVNKLILDDVIPELKAVAWHNYLRCCLNAYISICDRPEYGDEARQLKQALLTNRDRTNLLSRNERIKMVSILIAPTLFKKMYRFYEMSIQKKRYE